MIYAIDIFGLDISFETLKANTTTWCLINIAIATTLSIISFYLTKKIILRIVSRLVKKTKTIWDDYLFKRRFFHKAAYFAPAIVMHYYIEYTGDFELSMSLKNIIYIYMLSLTMILFSTLLDSINDIYSSYEVSKQKPIKGFIQIVKILLGIVIAIIIISVLIDKSPKALLTGLGAFAAVIMLVFKDSILGFVAGINLSANDMLHIGDWIVMDSSGADGDVTEISLTTVKVQNWDKTIVTIPTYKLMTESFVNWRGMTESGGRRIKRSINIDMKSIKFLSNDEIERFKGYKLLTDYINQKCNEIKQTNESETVPVNQTRLTNLGIFRKYLQQYISSHPLIHDDMTFMIRQLQSTEKGVPLEIYCFSNVQNWVDYENIQSDIFDHVLAVIPEFDLKVFQSLSEIK